MKQKIVRADGIEYERNKRNIVYDTMISTRISKTHYNGLREIAKNKKIKPSVLHRQIIEEYLCNH